MTIAVLPFNAGPNTRPALARQFANFACDIVREQTGETVNAVSYLVRLDGPEERYAMVNPSEGLNEPEMLRQLFEQAGVEYAMDGLLVEKEGQYELTYRFFDSDLERPTSTVTQTATLDGLFPVLREMLARLAEKVGGTLKEELDSDEALFGTENPLAFITFLEGFDAFQYVDRSQGRVAAEFDPANAMHLLVEAVKMDLDWEAPYLTLIQLCRLCTQLRLADPKAIESSLNELMAAAPEDARAAFALGEFFEAVGNPSKASDLFEKAHTLDPQEPAILTRLGIAQMNLGMPVNAERNFRKALESEGDDKPSMPFLAKVLGESGRGHEVPGLWREMISKLPNKGALHANLAMSLLQAGKQDEAYKAFEDGLVNAPNDAAAVKRFYAPVLAQNGQLDRAMDYYEDCLDENPSDVALLMEYAQTLMAANRSFEAPKVLRDVLSSNPEPDTRANALAMLIEVEQPKRVEAVASAQQKLQEGDPASAVRELRPLKTWLADYWKMWALYASALNATGEHAEAEEAARRLTDLYPGCEPAYGELVAALGAQGKHEDAYQIMRFAAQNIQGSIPIAINLALAAKRLGREDEARDLVRQIREAVGQNSDLEQVLSEVGLS